MKPGNKRPACGSKSVSRQMRPPRRPAQTGRTRYASCLHGPVSLPRPAWPEAGNTPLRAARAQFAHAESRGRHALARKKHFSSGAWPGYMNVHASWCGSAPQAGRAGIHPGVAPRTPCARAPAGQRCVWAAGGHMPGRASRAASLAARTGRAASFRLPLRRPPPAVARQIRLPARGAGGLWPHCRASPGSRPQPARGAVALQALYLFGFAQGDSSPRYGPGQSGAAGRAKAGLATESAAPPAQARAGIFRRDRSGLNRARRLAGGQRSIVMVRTPEKLPACM